ncbi:S53 family peptidase [Lentilactobacillus parakefiri]|nr:protease pro-enzyme activation domain-containing protein [Lentilactobacillus parakefiri]
MMKKSQYLMLSLIGFASVMAVSSPSSAKTKVPTTVSVVFNARDQIEMNDYVNKTVDPTSPFYHQYLTPNQVAQKYGRTASKISDFNQYFRKYHLKSAAYPGNFVMKVSGSQTNLVKAFKAFRTKSNSRKAVTKTRLPEKLSSQVASVLGLYIDNKKSTKKPAKQFAKISSNLVEGDKPAATNSTTEFAKKYGTQKFINRYGVNKLYDKDLHGQGQRIGVIVTDDFNRSDVAQYWKSIGVSADTARIHKIYTTDKTNGPTVKSTDDLESLMEATLDVSQAGAVADQSQLDAYIGVTKGDTIPDVQYLNDFAQAVSDNRDKQLTTSTSFGDELTGFGQGGLSETISQFSDAINLVYEQAALQGISIFNAIGDHGPYEETNSQQNLSLPTSEYAVQVGGTTLPYQKIMNGVVVNVSKERAWGDTYSQGSLTKPAVFAGGGGGFSRLNPTPAFQQGVSGVNTYNAFDVLKYAGQKGYLINPNPGAISGTHQGRNVPDVSGIADLNTGYANYVSYKVGKQRQGIWLTLGGTSMVAPQMAGASAVINSGLKTSTGFWNPQLYKFAVQPDTPFHVLDDATMANTNLFYTGQPGKVYNQATGLGTVDFNKLFNKFEAQE